MKGDMIERYQASDRINHWLTAICFVLLALSGLALFHPSLFWLTSLLGGGPWTRILHPFIGVVMFLSFLGLFLRFRRHNGLDAKDRQWLRQWRDVLNNREDALPEVGRYNGGQKALFWVMAVTVLLLLVSGIVIWQPYFAPAFNITVIRWAVLIHAVSAFVLILGIIVHVYAAIWVKGTIGAMTRGVVSRTWAKRHHPGWYKELTK
jgi:formate dehydrogenase subunit gamma